ncbi:MAG: HAD hydrolase family protein [Candidatus Endonucleobacter sp. (ex Gigantidas childressi)]|nr:HAD hydrolase family protein [Candidatus Endonucleobacter sp. (ex Gigantidas childressi)]
MKLFDFKMNIDDIDVFVFDFDGVLTNNLVYLNQDGVESVVCSRADGLAFDVLRKLGKPAFILSTEVNVVVSARAKKLKIEVLQGSKDKVNSLKEMLKNKGFNKEKVLFVGNDVNDYQVIEFCGYSACPSDSHSKIKEISDIVLNTNGGSGIVRELLEDVFGLDFIKILY